MLTWLLAPPLCWSCGAAVRSAERLCISCRRGLRLLGPTPVGLAGVAVWAPVAYEGPARALVGALKFRAAMAAADIMAALMAANAPDHLLPRRGPPPAEPPSEAPLGVSPASPRHDPPALVPVPLHPARRRRRGYNPAAVLAAAVAARTGLSVVDCLTRAGSSRSQVGRPRAERLAAPPGRLSARAPPPASVLVIDDVATTGATLAACARALRAAGAREVRAATFARTLGR
jgi:predicted amidophosphoribosyltransferase